MRNFKGEVVKDEGKTVLATFDFKVPNEASDHEIEQTARQAALDNFDWGYDEVGTNGLPADIKLESPWDITLAGFNHPQANNPFIYSSDNWMLFEFGAWASRENIEQPEEIKRSRGYSVRADGVVFKWHRDVGGRAIFRATQ